MWFCMNDAFLSVVENRDDPNTLLVRARVKGHIERVFPAAKTFVKRTADYPHRALVSRGTVAQVMADRITEIDYDNFKDSVPENSLHDAYSRVWGVMRGIQN